MVKRLFFFLILLGLTSTFAADAPIDESNLHLPTASLMSRPLCVEFSVTEKPYVLVRATSDDARGFAYKSIQKSQSERTQFVNQFGLKNALATLQVYALATKHPCFAEYVCGLFSIFALNPDQTGTFVGELILHEENLSSEGCIEIAYDISPSMRRKGITFAAAMAAYKKIIDSNLGKKLFVFDNQAVQSEVKKVFDRAFVLSKMPLTMVKSIVAFDNLPSLCLQRKIGLSPWNFSADYSIVYAYPPQQGHIYSGALTYIDKLFHPEEREEAICVLRASIDQMLRQQ